VKRVFFLLNVVFPLESWFQFLVFIKAYPSNKILSALFITTAWRMHRYKCVCILRQDYMRMYIYKKPANTCRPACTWNIDYILYSNGCS